jgi:nitrogen fixation/metabolism regulation signal transduction histidine kinase
MGGAKDSRSEEKGSGGTEHAWVKVSTEWMGNAVEIRVRNNGRGSRPTAIRQKLFEPFFNTKPTGEGTGLGPIDQPRDPRGLAGRQAVGGV